MKFSGAAHGPPKAGEMMMKRMEHILGEVTTYQAGFAELNLKFRNHLMLTWLESPSVVDVFPIGKGTFALQCSFSLE